MSKAFVVLKLEGGQIDPLPGVTGYRNSPGGIGLSQKILKKAKWWLHDLIPQKYGLI